MRILGIETSCDETSIALIEFNNDTKDFSKATFKVLSHIVNSQIELHKQFGGVFPMMAKREHAKNILPIYESVSKSVESTPITLDESTKSNLSKLLEKEPELLALILEKPIPNPNIDLITVTEGPGLEPALWVGLNFAKALSLILNVPIMPANHMEGHIIGSLINSDNLNTSSNIDFGAIKDAAPVASPDLEIGFKNISFPALALLISGGHTEIVLINTIGEYKIIGATRDDSVGEAFDKVARLLDLPYPGGPEISRLAEYARNNLSNESFDSIKKTLELPRPMINSNDLDFSFSGIKTAVLYLVKNLKEKISATNQDLNKENPENSPGAEIKLDLETKALIALEFENAVTEVILSKISKAVDEYNINDLILGGGVAANIHIKKELLKYTELNGLNLHTPLKDVTGDNALMITLAGAIKYSINPETKSAAGLSARGNLSLES